MESKDSTLGFSLSITNSSRALALDAPAYRDDLAALSRAWGERFETWDAVLPPDGQKAGPEGIDTRQSWSDFIHWYNWWLDEISWRSLPARLGRSLPGPAARPPAASRPASR